MGCKEMLKNQCLPEHRGNGIQRKPVQVELTQKTQHQGDAKKPCAAKETLI